MHVHIDNIFAGVPQRAREEEFLTLLESGAVKIERIVSRSYSSPPEFWYDQPADEWVMVVRGYAKLEFEGGELVEMKQGDYVTIPRHVKHRVHETGAETIWLAVHTEKQLFNHSGVDSPHLLR